MCIFPAISFKSVGKPGGVAVVVAPSQDCLQKKCRSGVQTARQCRHRQVHVLQMHPNLFYLRKAYHITDTTKVSGGGRNANHGRSLGAEENVKESKIVHVRATFQIAYPSVVVVTKDDASQYVVCGTFPLLMSLNICTLSLHPLIHVVVHLPLVGSRPRGLPLCQE